MALAINPNPYVRTKRTTFSIMMELLIALALVWIAGIIYYFTKGAGTDGLFAILNVVICAVVSFGVEILFFIPKWKNEEGHNFVSLLKKGLNSYGYISGIILALILPIMTNPNALVHIVNLIITTVVSGVGSFALSQFTDFKGAVIDNVRTAGGYNSTTKTYSSGVLLKEVMANGYTYYFVESWNGSTMTGPAGWTGTWTIAYN